MNSLNGHINKGFRQTKRFAGGAHRLLKRLNRMNLYMVALLCTAVLLCNCVDELVPTNRENLNLEIRTVLNTNLALEIETKIKGKLDTVLPASEIESLKAALETRLTQYFAKEIKDLSLYAYSWDSDEALEDVYKHEENVGKTSITFSIPFGNYHLVAVSCARDTFGTKVLDISDYKKISLNNAITNDTIEGHTYGVYTNKRILLNPKNGETVDLPIYMNNGVLALNVVKSDSIDFKITKLYAAETSDSYTIDDSTFFFNKNIIVDYNIEKTTSHVITCYALHYPTKRLEGDTTATSIHATRVNDETSTYPVNLSLIVDRGNGKYTKSDMLIAMTVDPGTVTIVNAVMTPDGSIRPLDEVKCVIAVNVDWNPGNEYDVDI